MKTQHTPAPWAIETCNENGPFLDSFYITTKTKTWDDNENERVVCRFPTGTGQFGDIGQENLANARLIAAAPDLLSVLIQLLPMAEAHYKTSSEGAPSILVARAAIAKAKGEA